MKVTLTLPDDLADFYRAEADQRDQPLESVLEGRLTRGAELDPRERYVILIGSELKAIEKALGGLPQRDSHQLVRAVERQARIKFGEHVLDLTPGQYEEIAWRGMKQGKSIAQMLEIAFATFSEQFFTLMPGRS